MGNNKSEPGESGEGVFESDDLDINKTFELSEKVPGYFWCLHCERGYKRGKFRMQGSLQMCPYPGCDGDAVMDAWDWGKIRDANPKYPEVPEDGVHYPQYGE